MHPNAGPTRAGAPLPSRHRAGCTLCNQLNAARAAEDDDARRASRCRPPGGLCRCAVPCRGMGEGLAYHRGGCMPGPNRSSAAAAAAAAVLAAAAAAVLAAACRPIPPCPAHAAAAAAATAARQAPFASFAALLSQPKVAATAALAGFTAASERQHAIRWKSADS